MSGTTHDALVEAGSTWLWRRCVVIVTEMATATSETPDVIGFSTHGDTFLIECKTSRADFYNESKKPVRRREKMEGKGGMGNRRLYLAPKGVLKPEDMQNGWGLLELRGSRVYEVFTPRFRPDEEKDRWGETKILLSCLRRFGHAAEGGVSVKSYHYDPKYEAQLTCKTTVGFSQGPADNATGDQP